MPDKPQSFATVGSIAQKIGCSVHNVEYAIKSRNIKPVGMAGHARVFSEENVKQIVLALKAIKAVNNSRRPRQPA